MATTYRGKLHPLTKRVIAAEKRIKEIEAQNQDTDTRLEAVETFISALIDATEVAL